MTRLLAVALLATLLAATGCGGNDNSDRHAVDDYIRQIASVQASAKPSLAKANQTYGAFVKGKLSAGERRTRLAQAERDIRMARARLAAIRAPAAANRLRTLVLGYYDKSADLAYETKLLGDYEPAAQSALKPLAALNRNLQRSLRASHGGAAQARVLGRFAAGIGRSVDRLRRLHPPPLLLATHVGQVRRLDLTRRLAMQLHDALERQDARGVARLLLRFRRLSSTNSPGLARQAVDAYGRRYQALTTQAAAVEQERRRLESALR
jgi:hypothetical protein